MTFIAFKLHVSWISLAGRADGLHVSSVLVSEDYSLLPLIFRLHTSLLDEHAKWCVVYQLNKSKI